MGVRYIFRELIPRALLLTVTFKWVLPFLWLFHFNGDLKAAAIFGVAFTGFFWLLGSVIMGSAPAEAFLHRSAHKWWLPFMNLAIIAIMPAAALGVAAVAVPAYFSMNWIFGPIVGSVVLNVVCAITHDYASAKTHRCPTAKAGGHHPSDGCDSSS